MKRPEEPGTHKGFAIDLEKHTASWDTDGDPLWYAEGRIESPKDHFVVLSVECYATKDSAAVALRREIDRREAGAGGGPKKPKRRLRPARRIA